MSFQILVSLLLSAAVHAQDNVELLQAAVVSPFDGCKEVAEAKGKELYMTSILGGSQADLLAVKKEVAIAMTECLKNQEQGHSLISRLSSEAKDPEDPDNFFAGITERDATVARSTTPPEPPPTTTTPTTPAPKTTTAAPKTTTPAPKAKTQATASSATKAAGSAVPTPEPEGEAVPDKTIHDATGDDMTLATKQTVLETTLSIANTEARTLKEQAAMAREAANKEQVEATKATAEATAKNAEAKDAEATAEKVIAVTKDHEAADAAKATDELMAIALQKEAAVKEAEKIAKEAEENAMQACWEASNQSLVEELARNASEVLYGKYVSANKTTGIEEGLAQDAMESFEQTFTQYQFDKSDPGVQQSEKRMEQLMAQATYAKTGLELAKKAYITARAKADAQLETLKLLATVCDLKKEEAQGKKDIVEERRTEAHSAAVQAVAAERMRDHLRKTTKRQEKVADVVKGEVKGAQQEAKAAEKEVAPSVRAAEVSVEDASTVKKVSEASVEVSNNAVEEEKAVTSSTSLLGCVADQLGDFFETENTASLCGDLDYSQCSEEEKEDIEEIRTVRCTSETALMAMHTKIAANREQINVLRETNDEMRREIRRAAGSID